MATLLHPNGFIQHDLPDGARLHVWADDLPPAQLIHTPIHDHTFLFESRVVMGMLIHETFNWLRLEGDAGLWFDKEGYTRGYTPTHKLYEVAGALLVDTGRRGIVYPGETMIHGVYASYGFGGPGHYHDTRGAEGIITATIMRKVKTDMAPNPTVLIPIGMEPDNDFRRDQYSEERLMPWVKRVLDYMEARNA